MWSCRPFETLTVWIESSRRAETIREYAEFLFQFDVILTCLQNADGTHRELSASWIFGTQEGHRCEYRRFNVLETRLTAAYAQIHVLHLLQRTSPAPANVREDASEKATGASNSQVPCILTVDGRGASGTEETAGECVMSASIGPQRGNLCSNDSWGPRKLSVTSFTFDALTLFWAYATYVLLLVDTE